MFDQLENWWTTSGATGSVPIKHLAPNPDQPRQYFDPDDLRELAVSAANIGIHNRLIVTPRLRAPWARVGEEYKDAFFVIISGHRRRRAGEMAHLAELPVEVRIYASERDFMVATSLLNYQQRQLLPIEQGWEIHRLRKLGCSAEEIQKMFGFSAPVYYGRLNLTKLDDELLGKISPEVVKQKGKMALPIMVAAALGGLKPLSEEDFEQELSSLQKLHPSLTPRMRFDLSDEGARARARQLLYYDVIMFRKLQAAKAVEFVRTGSIPIDCSQRQHGNDRHLSVGRVPEKVMASGLLRSLVNHGAFDLKSSDVHRACYNMSREQIETLLRELLETKELLEGVTNMVRKQLMYKNPSRT